MVQWRIPVHILRVNVRTTLQQKLADLLAPVLRCCVKQRIAEFISDLDATDIGQNEVLHIVEVMFFHVWERLVYLRQFVETTLSLLLPNALLNLLVMHRFLWTFATVDLHLHYFVFFHFYGYYLG